MVNKITLLTNGVPPHSMGGMQTHSASLATNLASCGIDVDVFYPLARATARCKTFASTGIREFQFVPEFHRRLPGHYVRESRSLSARYLARYLNESPSDLIYAKGMLAYAFLKARKAAGSRVPPIVTNVHGYEAFQYAATWTEALKGAMLRPAFRYVIQASDYVVSYGGRITELLASTLKVPRERVLEIPGAVASEFLKIPTSDNCERIKRRRSLGFVGRYERRKGLEELATVLSSGLSDKFDVHIVGPIPGHIQRLFPADVNFPGAVSERCKLVAMLDGFDVLVSPSWSEGMPNVILEAMSRKTAIIATDVGATADLVNRENGILVAPRSSSDLRKALVKMSEIDEFALREMQKTSETRVREEFSWAHVGPLTVRKLTELCDRNGQCQSAA